MSDKETHKQLSSRNAPCHKSSTMSTRRFTCN